MLYKRVPLEEGQEIQFVGCYVLKWPFDVLGEPEVGFVEVIEIDDSPIDYLLEVITGLEWGYQGVCACCMSKPDKGHKPKCSVAAALAWKGERRD